MTLRFSTAALEDVCVKITDGTHYTPPETHGRFPFLTVKNINNEGNLDLADCIWIDDAEFAKAVAGDSAPQKGDVLFSKDGTVGKVHLVDGSARFAVLSSIALLRPDPSKILPEYLAVCARMAETVGQAAGRKTGSAIRRIILRDLKKVRIPIPPLEEQRRIVDILDRANGIRRLRREALDKTRQLIPALFLDIFGDPATNPKGWPRVSFDTLVAFSRYGPRFHNRGYSSDGARILRTTDISYDGTLNYANSPAIEVTEEELHRYSVRPRTMLFTRTGATIGKCALFSKASEPCIAGAYLIEARLSDEIAGEYALAFFSSGHGQGALLQGSRAMAQPNINLPALKSIQVPLPPPDLQREFANLASEARAARDQQERMAEASELLVASLMSQLFDGPSSSARAAA